MPPLLTPGATIARSELHALLGGRLQGRISPSKTTPVISLFTAPGAHDSQHDGWTGQHFHFQGEGQGEREQQIKQGNRALAEHASSGRLLRLFVTIPDGLVRYLGAYRVDPDISYVQVSLPVVGDPAHPPRTGYVFRLLPEAGTRGRKLTSTEQVADRLLRDYGDHLRLLNRDVRRHHVTPARELLPLPVDLLDHTTNELIACSGSVTRTHMLAAFGELLDMRRFFNPTPRRVMLVPTEPRPGLAGLCAENDITLVWPDGTGSFCRCAPRDAKD